MVTKEHAHKFCSTFNAALPGDEVPLMLDGPEPFATVTKGQEQLLSTEHARIFMSDTLARAVKHLNESHAR